MSILDTGIKFVKNVGGYTIGEGTCNELYKIMDNLNISNPIVFIDHYFTNIHLNWLSDDYPVIFVDTTEEPTTDGIDSIANKAKFIMRQQNIDSIIAIGGGSTMDTAKAVGNLISNPGKAEDYQGWDLVKVPSLKKIAIPTIPGTGAEATRTCVMTNKKSKLKLGMNSDYSVFDFIIMDSNLSATVPKDQYFYTAMDAYIHCIESLHGQYRNFVSDALSKITVSLCHEIFSDGQMQSPENREKMMVASMLGGSSIASSYVGLIHPFSAALSTVYGTKHCIGNCIAIKGLKQFYHSELDTIMKWMDINQVACPKLDEVATATEEEELYSATIMHEKPLFNALGHHYLDTLSKKNVVKIFEGMR